MTNGITFRRVERGDFPLLVDWLRQPHVTRWWWDDESTSESVERDFGRPRSPSTDDLLALLDGEPVGLVVRSRLGEHPDALSELAAVTAVSADARTLDYLVGDPARTGRGIGTAMLRAAVADTWRTHPNAPAVVVVVSVENVASRRALERAGFCLVAEWDVEPETIDAETVHRVYRADRPDQHG